MAQLMRTKIIGSELIKTYQGIGIVRTRERKVLFDNSLSGPIYVWYEVRLADGEGQTIKSFKKQADAEDFMYKLVIK